VNFFATEVPAGVVTVTSTSDGASPFGIATVIFVAVTLAATSVAAVVPNFTAVALVKFCPAMSMVSPTLADVIDDPFRKNPVTVGVGVGVAADVTAKSTEAVPNEAGVLTFIR
jgi:hypothetical protein